MYSNGTCRDCEPIDGEIYQYFDDGHTEIMAETTTPESEEEFEMVDLEVRRAESPAINDDAIRVWIRLNKNN